MASLQLMIVSARALRAELVPGNVSLLEATLYARDAAYEVAAQEREAIERLAHVRLAVEHGSAPHPGGAVRSTPDFDLWLHLPAADLSSLRARLQKEIDQLAKAAANSERQLSNDEFMRKAPEKVVAGIRVKLADYQAQLAKSRATLEALGQ
jgi:valyl-tRNA synthetase